MIRHSSSFFLSFVIHVIFILIILFVYQQFFSQKKEKTVEHRVCVQLCALEVPKPKPVIEKKEILKVKPKPKPKPKPKKVQKKKVKKIVKKKPKKEVVAKKEIFIAKEVPKPVVIVPEVIEEMLILKEEPVVEEIVEAVQVESASQKKVRLEKTYLDENILKIRELISENLYYPRSARKRGVVGEVIVRFNLSPNAQVHSTSIISSQSDILSRAAIKTIKDLDGEFPKPQEELTLHVPISYRLN